jgi:hypothetical protein
MNGRAHHGLLLAVALLAAEAACQTTGTATPQSSRSSAKDWSLAATAYGYIVPDDRSYFSPVFTADRRWLHLEARYNYENFQTGSLWAGYNFTISAHKLVFNITPMIGGVFGDTSGIAPGYEMSVTCGPFELSSEGEQLFTIKSRANDFFYSWNELVYSPTDWIHAGLVAQTTRAYQTPLDIQRGVLLGFARKKVDFTTYVFNFGWTDPTVVMGLSYKF